MPYILPTPTRLPGIGAALGQGLGEGLSEGTSKLLDAYLKGQYGKVPVYGEGSTFQTPRPEGVSGPVLSGGSFTTPQPLSQLQQGQMTAGVSPQKILQQAVASGIVPQGAILSPSGTRMGVSPDSSGALLNKLRESTINRNTAQTDWMNTANQQFGQAPQVPTEAPTEDFNLDAPTENELLGLFHLADDDSDTELQELAIQQLEALGEL